MKDMVYIERFWSRVDTSGDCWNWADSLVHNGYGSFCAHLEGRQYWRAHRFSWALFNGPIPEGMGVLHKCDNRACVRPSHLFLGDQRDNLKDAAEKGRIIGVKNSNSRLTENDVRAIRASEETDEALGQQYGVHPAHISKIRVGRAWRHLL